jgi:hypothetical protein
VARPPLPRRPLRRYRWPLVLAIAVGAGVVVLAVLPVARPSPSTGPSELAPAATVAAAAERASVQVQGHATTLAVVADPAGIAIAPVGPTRAPVPSPRDDQAPIPTPTLAVRLASGTVVAARVVDDNLRGISAIVPEGGAGGLAALPRGSSGALRPGDQLILAGGGSPATLTYRGRAETLLGTSGFAQQVLDLELPPGAALAPGPVLDRAGALIGLVVLERQAGAPPGHVYAVPVEQAASLLQRALAPTGTPEPTRTPRNTPAPDEED